MIIKLSPIEVKNFVAIALGLSGTPFALEIEAHESPLLVALRTAFTENPRFSSDQKISCIKRFRDLSRTADGNVVQLSEAKWAVENPREALSNLELTGKILPL